MGIVTNSARLLVKLQGQGSTLVELERDSFTIGRKPDNDLSIEDHTVSSRHAKIIRVQSVYFLEDLKSTNGTAVNGQAIERAQLHDADVITIGQHRIIFRTVVRSLRVPHRPLWGSIKRWPFLADLCKVGRRSRQESWSPRERQTV